MHPGYDVSLAKRGRDSARREEPGLGADHDFVALEFTRRKKPRERCPDRALRALMSVIDRRIEEIDSAANRGRDRSGVSIVGGAVRSAQVGPQAERRGTQPLRIAIELGGNAGSVALRACSCSSAGRQPCMELQTT